MRGRVVAVAAAVALAAPVGCAAPAPAVPPEPAVMVRDDLRDVFAGRGLTGTFALLDTSTGGLTVVDRPRAEQPAVPASSFKIAHSLIALQTGVVGDVDEVVPYGGQPQPLPAWERDMSMREAVPASNVPVFQEIARRIGPERERAWLDLLDYGDEEVGPVVDRFWLDGPLEISPVAQARFLARLADRSLPVDRAVQDAVAEILVLERSPDGTLFGKTGWRFETTPQLGWWVGWVERPDGRVHTFALNMDMAGADDAARRVEIGRELLARLGVLREPSG